MDLFLQLESKMYRKYKGGGIIRVTWWRQKAAEYQLRVTVEKSIQRQGCGGNRNPAGVTGARMGWRGGSQTVRSRVNTGGIRILVRRLMTPRWEDDYVRMHVGGGAFFGRRELPLPEGNQVAGRDGETGQVNKYITISDRA